MQKVHYGFGALPALPVPERERPVVPDPEIIVISPDGARTIGKNAAAIRGDIARNAQRVNDIYVLAEKLSDKGRKAVRIRMPSGAECTVGGEALIGALARGGQPV
jgi:hypothetical protein